MILKTYSIFDRKAGVYLTPFFAVNDQVADRSFQALAKRPESTIASAPEDFSLYRIGEFCDDSGEITPSAPDWVSNIKIQ